MAVPSWQSVAVLIDPVRRALYDYVRHQDHPVTREEAADAHAISRNLTAFHLDKLVEAKLLRAHYQALSVRPRRRGRAPKVYEPAGDGLAVTIPPRRYDIVADILADAVAAHPANAAAAAAQLAFDHGRQLGQQSLAAGAARPAPGAPDPAPDAASGHADQLARIAAVLDELGFEPGPDAGAGALSLRNCPFHRLAARQPELVCRLNEAFVRGVLAGVRADGVCATLEPRPDTCCVVVRPAGQRASRSASQASASG